MLASVGWPDVVLAVVAAVPGTIAAVGTILVRREVRTPNGATLGETATQTKAVVTRTLGEREGDRLARGGKLTPHKRADDVE